MTQNITQGPTITVAEAKAILTAGDTFSGLERNLARTIVQQAERIERVNALLIEQDHAEVWTLPNREVRAALNGR